MNLSFSLLVAIVAATWLLSLAVGLLAIWFGCLASPRRFNWALGSSVASLAIAFAGLNWFHFSITRTTNGSSFSLNSKWFFLGTVGLAIIGLALALWRRQGSPPTAG